MHTGYLLGSLAAAAMTLAVAGPAQARDDERAYCLTLTHRAVQANAQAGKWLDRVTRHDGVVIECDDKRIEFRRFSSLAPNRAGDEWREHTEQAWRRTQCTDARSRQAINKGWTIRATYTMATGENVSFNAEDCD